MCLQQLMHMHLIQFLYIRFRTCTVYCIVPINHIRTVVLNCMCMHAHRYNTPSHFSTLLRTSRCARCAGAACVASTTNSGSKPVTSESESPHFAIPQVLPYGKHHKISLPRSMFFSGKKSLTCNLLRIFLRKQKNIFFKSYLCKIICSETACTNEICANKYPIFAFIHFKKLSDIVASFINTCQLQYCVLPFYFLALCLPLLFLCQHSSNSNQTSSSQKPEEKPPKLPPTRQRFKFKFQN